MARLQLAMIRRVYGGKSVLAFLGPPREDVGAREGEVWVGLGTRVRWRSVAGQDSIRTASVEADSGSNHRTWVVLYVEDSRYLQEGMPWRMKRGYEAGAVRVEGYRNGKEALQKYSDEPGRYSCIVSDLVLPGLDGCELMRCVRGLERERGLRPIPAIALSAHEERKEECFDVGFNAFYIKGSVVCGDVVCGDGV